ncbi:unnamed protein product [Durusdinium trenchii]|uniref:Major facilitator superfamily (MFS) profile domain-containing protein n=1 Tax=Durusdinium trenchii TaxID=1381693 RepID=A0ABP0I097_9DINO
MIVMTNITHALKHEFHFSNWQAGSLDAFSFSGLAIGHYVAGFLADLKGRRLPIVLGYLGISLVGLFMTLASGYKSMVLLRIFHGIACGVGVPPAMSMIAEIMPSDWRPFMFIIFWSFTAVGETYAALGLIIFMPSLTESTSWKQAVLWSALPAFLMLLSSLARLQESAHWLAVRGHLVEARIVLEQMARMNQKLDVLKKLGTLPACSHDLSILYNVALFSVLASTGNIETFGLSNVWPELLRHEAHGLHEAVGPAVKLMFIVSVGIPVGVLCALISLSNAASHKIYIMIAGFLGCVGLTCILVFEHSSALLLTSMLITHMSGTLEYSVAMIWCEESFPTKVRASATGVVIFFGTLWSVTSPLLLTAVGEKGFILIAGVAFAMAPLAALPLQETHGPSASGIGAELQDFADEEDEEEDEIEEEDEDEIESSAPRRDGIQLSWAFSNGTIGAAMELSMIAGLLGAVPGVSFTSFYSSMGFIIHQSKDRSFFTKEMLLGNGIAVATHLFLRREEVEVEISVPFQKRLVSIFRRLVLSSLFLAVVNFFMAFCESEMSMLTLGSVQSFFNAILLNTSHALTKPLNRNGSVQLGFLSGALLPILTIPFTGFGPKSSLLSRLAFYLVPSSFCFLIGLLIWAYHRRVAMHLETAQTDDADADAPRNIADLAEAYKNFKETFYDATGSLHPRHEIRCA